MTNRFSARGERVTEFERQLVEQCGMEFPESMSDVWVVIARRVGVDALVVVLDEIGEEKIHVPGRLQFFDALYRPFRNRTIRELHASGISMRELATRFHMTPQRVGAIVSGSESDDRLGGSVILARP
ncbi:MAG: hypothetical protein IJI03_12275 [Rudaea sp.]|nr:hypothetical protein [Rudaea sp.]